MEKKKQNKFDQGGFIKNAFVLIGIDILTRRYFKVQMLF